MKCPSAPDLLEPVPRHRVSCSSLAAAPVPSDFSGKGSDQHSLDGGSLPIDHGSSDGLALREREQDCNLTLLGQERTRAEA